MPWTSPLPPGQQPPGPPLTPAEMDLLVARAGLILNPGQMADLVLAWRQLAGLIASIHRPTALVDDQAFVFRLPAPLAAPVAKPAARKAPAGKPAAKPMLGAKSKPAHKPKPSMKPKGGAKPKAATKPARRR